MLKGWHMAIEIEAYQFALRLANDNIGDEIRVIEKDFNDK